MKNGVHGFTLVELLAVFDIGKELDGRNDSTLLLYVHVGEA
jgi:hypothetical protein